MAATKKIGYAVVGLGNIARNSILPAFANCRRAKLVALVSRDKKKAAAVRAKFRAAISYPTKEYEDCLANPEISAVYIATPPGEHEEFTVPTPQAAKPLLSQNPLAPTLPPSPRLLQPSRRP